MTTILVADDHQDIRNLLVDTLLDSGYDVIEAKDGARLSIEPVENSPILSCWTCGCRFSVASMS